MAKNNNDPEQSPSRSIINFLIGLMNVRSNFHIYFKFLEEKVKPEREKQNDERAKSYGGYLNDQQEELYKNINSLKCCFRRCCNH